MCMWRLDMDRLQELVRLHRMDTGSCEVARLLGLSRTTERQYRTVLDAAGLLRGSADELPALETLKAAVEAALPPKQPPQSTTSLQRWVAHVQALATSGLGPRAIYDRLRLDHADFDGTYWAVKRLVKRLRRDRGVRAEDVAIPVETRPGEAAQVDFGEIGRLWDPAAGKLRRAWVFVMVLGQSRRMVARIAFDQRVETWIRLHVEAFAELGGVPEVIVYDYVPGHVIVGQPVGHGSEVLERSHVSVEKADLVLPIVDAGVVAPGMHQAHDQHPGFPSGAGHVDEHLEEIHLRQIARVVHEWHEHFPSLALPLGDHLSHQGHADGVPLG
jgi:hypothetical protein